jgi:hypothetical protein
MTEECLRNGDDNSNLFSPRMTPLTESNFRRRIESSRATRLA